MTTGHSVDVTFTLPLLARLALTFTAHCLSPFPLVLSHFLPRSLGRASKSVSVSSRPPIASDLVIAIMASVQHQHSCRLWIPCFCWLPLLVICFWPVFFPSFLSFRAATSFPVLCFVSLSDSISQFPHFIDLFLVVSHGVLTPCADSIKMWKRWGCTFDLRLEQASLSKVSDPSF